MRFFLWIADVVQPIKTLYAEWYAKYRMPNKYSQYEQPYKGPYTIRRVPYIYKWARLRIQ
jgi:hypothetical protein